jgi:antitoxin component of RelBE/YafQ-DinJ toxin-antitoxin module
MGYAVVTTKLDPQTKKDAQKTAAELGVPLSILVKGFLKQLIETKTFTFSAQEEVPNAYLRKVIKKAEENYKKGNVSPAFKTGKEAVAWLEKQGI